MKRISFILFGLLFACFSLGAIAVGQGEEPSGASLVERLGYDKDAKLLIINADDFGMCHSANEGTLLAFSQGGISSATVMTTCPWFLEAVEICKVNPGYDVGVHTVLTNEWKRYKWGPVLGWKEVPSLCTEMGYMHESVPLVYLSARLEEVEKEVRAQIERAVVAGIDITHIDSHMGTMQYDPRYLAIYAKLAKEFDLPCRMPAKSWLEENFGQGEQLDQFDDAGILHPDVLIMGGAPSPDKTEEWWKSEILKLPTGTVSELYIHCADDSPEMKKITGSQKQRLADTLFFSDPETIRWLHEQGIQLISYRILRDLQRKAE